MKRPLILVCVVLILKFGSISQAQDQTTRPSKPNIIVLLTDDLGWQDVDCYDIGEPNAYVTPNIDALAKKGVLFWRAYSPAPTCAPSRCAIVSGVHPARAQKTHIKGGKPPMPIGLDSRMMSPWYSARTPVGDYTIAAAMRDAGYATGHVGKWHISYSEPKATDLGFDVSYGSRISKALMKDRLKDFATTEQDDPYKLDKNGFPHNQTTENALKFITDYQAKPFFLYYATWLVHAPIQTRSRALLEKYAAEMGIDPSDKKSFSGQTTGQKNPFYAAMVEELDYNIGRVFEYLDTTDDPRWPGHKLIENTYIIFTSDNGGTEGKTYERYTDNTPLDLGKTSIKEGGIRVPFIVTGPNIPTAVETNVLINGLDIYPTVLAMAGAELPKKTLDGLNLFPLLTGDPTNADLVKTSTGNPRTSMMWHFPHTALESAIIEGDFKLIKNYDYLNNPGKPQFELYQLSTDIEEATNLADAMPEKVKTMDGLLTDELSEMKAKFPHYSPYYRGEFPNKDKIPAVKSHQIDQNKLSVNFRERGATVIEANLVYSTQDDGVGYREWFIEPMELSNSGAQVTIPKGTKYAYINLIDENNFLTSYPKVKPKKKAKDFTVDSIKVTD